MDNQPNQTSQPLAIPPPEVSHDLLANQVQIPEPVQAKPPVSKPIKMPSNHSVAYAISATVVIVIVLSALAVYAYLKQH